MTTTDTNIVANNETANGIRVAEQRQFTRTFRPRLINSYTPYLYQEWKLDRFLRFESLFFTLMLRSFEPLTNRTSFVPSTCKHLTLREWPTNVIISSVVFIFHLQTTCEFNFIVQRELRKKTYTFIVPSVQPLMIVWLSNWTQDTPEEIRVKLDKSLSSKWLW